VVASKTLHPEWTSDEEVDAAILKLETPIGEDAESFIGYATLPETGTDPAGGTLSLAAGWCVSCPR
jgi:trypsin